MREGREWSLVACLPEGIAFHIPPGNGRVSETLNNYFKSLTRLSFYISVQYLQFFLASYAMSNCSTFHCLFCYALLLLNCAACFSAAQDGCIYRSGAMLIHSVVVVKHTIHIITSVPHDTTFQVKTDLTITVDNAPTSLDLLTTYFSRSTAIETVKGSVIPIYMLSTAF